jgi:hypothetical protein
MLAMRTMMSIVMIEKRLMRYTLIIKPEPRGY